MLLNSSLHNIKHERGVTLLTCLPRWFRRLRGEPMLFHREHLVSFWNKTETNRSSNTAQNIGGSTLAIGLPPALNSKTSLALSVPHAISVLMFHFISCLIPSLTSPKHYQRHSPLRETKTRLPKRKTAHHFVTRHTHTTNTQRSKNKTIQTKSNAMKDMTDKLVLISVFGTTSKNPVRVNLHEHVCLHRTKFILTTQTQYQVPTNLYSYI